MASAPGALGTQRYDGIRNLRLSEEKGNEVSTEASSELQEDRDGAGSPGACSKG